MIYAADYALVDGDTLARAALRDREIRLATRPSDCTCADEYGPVSPYCDPCLTFDDEVRAATERMDDREPALAREVIRLNEELAVFRAAVKDESKHLSDIEMYVQDVLRVAVGTHVPLEEEACLELSEYVLAWICRHGFGEMR